MNLSDLVENSQDRFSHEAVHLRVIITVDYNFVIYVSYLPPERSNRGRDAQSFFSHILSEIYMNYENDAIFVIGDLNSRIVAMPDTSSDFDGIPPRKTLDKTINQHGPLSPIGRIKILTYLIWGFLGAAILGCIIRSCDLFYRFIRTCLGPTVVPAAITSLELFCVLAMCYFSDNVSSIARFL